MNILNTILNHYGLIAGFLFISMENIGIPFPIEFVYIYGQNLVENGQQPFWLLVVLFGLAHTFGATLSYFLGFYGNGYFSNKFKANQNAQKAKRNIERWYKNYGLITSLFVRFVGYVRPWSSFFAGFGKQKFSPFLIYTFIGSCLFNIIVLKFSGLLLFLWNNYQWAKYLISFGFIFFFVGIWFLFPFVKKRLFPK